MLGYQFVHMECYSAKGKTTAGPEDQHNKKRNGQIAWNAQQIIDELERLEHASQHVIAGRPSPEIVPGDVDSFDALREAQIRAASIRTPFPYTKPDGTVGQRKRKIRGDSASIYTSVVSLPVRTADALADEALAARSKELLHKAVAHERTRLESSGGRFMMGVIHWDEEHLHVHIMGLDPVRGVVKHLHPGQVAKAEAIESAQRSKVAKGEANKLGNVAYCDAMRGWQDDFHEAVFKDAGLMRYGPRRERLSTAEYKRAKVSARFRADNEEHRRQIECAKSEVSEELERAKATTASADQKASAFEAGVTAVCKEKISYKPSSDKKKEGLKFGRKAPSDMTERKNLAERIQPAFDLIVRFAKRMATVDNKMDATKAMADDVERRQKIVNEREHDLDCAEARVNWRSRGVDKVVNSMKSWVPKSLTFIVAALERGDDPVSEKTAESFPGAWSVAKNSNLQALQNKIDEMPNADLMGCFSATQDAYMLTEDAKGLQSTFATGIKILIHEAGQRGLDIESGKHDPSKALSPKRGRLHTDCLPTPLRIRRVIRERQLVR